MVLLCGKLQQGESDIETGGHDGHHAHQLNKNVEGGTGGVLEGVTHGVTHNGSVMSGRVFATEGSIARLDVLLGVVPGTIGVGHEHSKHEATGQTTSQQS